MNLEQRVQVLEQEVQLLKAQIQATLLDMQEQLLNTKYPMLRAEEPTQAAPPTAEAPVAAPVNASPIKRVTLTPEPDPDEPVNVRQMGAPIVAEDDLDEDEPVQPVVRARSNGHLPAVAPDLPKPRRAAWEEPEYQPPRQNHVAESPKPARAEPVTQPVESSATSEDIHDWIELENWVSQKVEKLGINRTRELINLYTRQERFSRQEREMLLQFVSIYDGVPKSPAKPKLAANATPTRPTIVPQTRAVVEEIRTELRQKRAAAKNKNESYRLSEQQELVMRLIAGILSAGDDDFPSDGGF